MNNSPRMAETEQRAPLRSLRLLCALIVLVASVSAARAQNPADPQAVAPPGPPQFRKSEALAATITALALNNTEPAWDALKKILTGETVTAGHDHEAAKIVLNLWVGRRTPEADAFLVQLICDAEQIRQGKGTYNAPELRKDTAEVLSLAASPGLRGMLAAKFVEKQTSEEARGAIAMV
ncbi:MAG: hypothetical protein AB7O26_20250, partial [Planctomycetaceae bacterium]